MVRWVLGAVASLIVGAMLLYRYFTGLPALEQLTPVTGDVTSADVETRRTRRSQSHLLAVRIGDHPAAYYPERFPDFEQIVAAVRPGDGVTAWVDVGKDNYIWQLEKEGKRLVSYDQVAEAQRSNARGNALFGALFVVVGLGVLGVMAWRWRTGSPAAPEGEKS